MKKVVNVLEIIFIIYLIAASIGKRNVIEFTPDFVTYSEGVEYSAENDSYTITHAENVTEEGYSMVGNGAMTIAPGAYEIEIRYESKTDENNPWGSCANKTGWAQIRSYKNPQSVHVGQIHLVDGSTIQKERMWITSLGDLTDLDFRILYTGTGTLTVYSIVVKELMMWRITRILMWILLFGAGEIVYGYFFSKKTHPNKKFAAGLIVIIFGSSLPVFCDFVIGGHDLMFHLARILALGQSIEAGNWWNPIEYNMVNGYGYATPLFYPQLFLYLPALLYSMVIPVHICYQVYVVCVNAATCLICFWCVYKLCKDKNIALLASFLYTFSAYRMADVYVRAAVGEFTAMAFFPLLVYGFIRVYNTEAKAIKVTDYMPIVFGLTGLLQSHMLSCELTAVLILLTCLLLIKKTFELHRFIALAKSVILTLLLNFGFIVAFLDSMRMNIHVKMNDVSTIQESGVYLIQLLGIYMTPSGLSNNNLYGDMPLCLGMSLAFGILIFLWCYSNRYEWKLEKDNYIRIGIILTILASVALVFTLHGFPWDSIAAMNPVLGKITSVIQFPWRYLAPATILCVFVTVMGILILKKAGKKSLCIGLGAFVCMLTLLNTGLLYMQYSDTSSTTKMFARISNWDSIVYIYGGEYLLEGTDILQCVNKEISTDTEWVSVQNYHSEDGFTSFECNNKSSDVKQVVIPLFNYDNYKVSDSDTGMELEVTTDDNNRMSVWVPGNYQGTVSIRYVVPVLWKLAYAISFVTLISIILVWGKKRLILMLNSSLPRNQF